MLSSILNNDLLRKIMCLGFTGYLTRGLGCIILKEPTNVTAAVSQELLNYIPYNRDDKQFPYEAVAMMANYDPMKEPDDQENALEAQVPRGTW